MAKNRLFGIGEPVSMFVTTGEVNAEETLSRVEALGATAVREWMHLPIVLSDPDTVKPEAKAAFDRVLNRYRELDIEITGLNHEWFLAGETLRRGHNEIYARDLTPDSLYMQTLELLERSWRTMATAFPQVTQWEVGNEWNLDTFLHPIGWEYGTPGFSEEEKMDIAVDLMYFSCRGIRQGNPAAKVVSFSPAVTQPNLGGRGAIYYPSAYGIALAISRIYERIKSGDFWSTNTDDFFDMVAIHPYMLTQIMPMAASEAYPAERRFFRAESPDAGWRAPIDMVYTIMSMNGDGKKQMRDVKGMIESNADRKLSVAVEGGELLGFGSANPRTEERFDSGSYTTCYGRAMAVIRAGEAGIVTVKVTGGKDVVIPIGK